MLLPRRPLTRLIRPVLGLLLMAAIFGWMGHKIAIHWADVRDRIGTISVARFAAAAVMFAVFLFAFRAVVWRRILDRLGCPVPLAPAVRVWSSSELARYIPGGIWQVAGRVYLIKPYGVGKTVCAASQILELIVFLLANILVGVGCLAAFGVRHVHGPARAWLFALAAAVPLLALLLHPSVSYGLLNAVFRWTGKPPLDVRLTGRELARLLAWNVVGLFWQSLAVFLIVAGPLGLHWDKWYVVTGAYSLAWCAGFLVVISPGGIGVREPVFATVMARGPARLGQGAVRLGRHAARLPDLPQHRPAALDDRRRDRS